jgi:hypothetical protein
MERSHHWLDESLSLCLDQNCNDLPTPTARMIINFTGAIRSLERQINEQSEMIQALYKRLGQFDPDIANEFFRQGVERLPIEEVVVLEEAA